MGQLVEEGIEVESELEEGVTMEGPLGKDAPKLSNPSSDFEEEGTLEDYIKQKLRPTQFEVKGSGGVMKEYLPRELPSFIPKGAKEVSFIPDIEEELTAPYPVGETYKIRKEGKPINLLQPQIQTFTPDVIRSEVMKPSADPTGEGIPTGKFIERPRRFDPLREAVGESVREAKAALLKGTFVEDIGQALTGKSVMETELGVTPGEYEELSTLQKMGAQLPVDLLIGGSLEAGLRSAMKTSAGRAVVRQIKRALPSFSKAGRRALRMSQARDLDDEVSLITRRPKRELLPQERAQFTGLPKYGNEYTIPPTKLSAQEWLGGEHLAQYPERQKLHEFILQKMSPTVEKESRILTIHSGSAGAGKSEAGIANFTPERMEWTLDANPDKFKKYIPEYNPSEPQFVHGESSALTGKAMGRAFTKGQEIAYETTGAELDRMKEILKRAKENNYNTQGRFFSQSEQQLKAAYERRKLEGARLPPLELSLKKRIEGSQNLPEYWNEFEDFVLYAKRGGESAKEAFKNEPIMIKLGGEARYAKGEERQITELLGPNWKSKVDSALPEAKLGGAEGGYSSEYLGRVPGLETQSSRRLKSPKEIQDFYKATPEGGFVPRTAFPKMVENTKAREAIDKATTDWMDDLNPLLVGQRVTQKIPEYEKNPYVHFRLLRGLGGKIQEKIDQELVPMLKKIDDPTEFVNYAQAKREIEKAAQLGKPVTDRSLDESAKIIRAYETPERKQLLTELVEFQNKSLDDLVDSGMVSRESADAMKNKNQWYVPFFREIDEGTQAIGKKGGAVLPRRLKGSKLPISDMVENVVKNTVARTRIAETNRSNQIFVDWLEGTPYGFKLEPTKVPIRISGKELVGQVEGAIDPEDMFTVFRSKTPKGEGQITVWKNGKPETWQFTQAGQDMFDAIKPYESKEKGVVLKYFFAPFSKMLRLGATGINPDFISRNAIRDTGARMFTTGGSSIKVIPDTIKALFEIVGDKTGLKASEMYRDWKKSGGSFSGMMGYDINVYRRVLANARNRGLADKVKYTLSHPIESLQALSQIVEEAPRLAEYKALLPKGKVPTQAEKMFASLGSRDVSLDFSKIGKKGREVNQYIAFFNAGLQDWSKIKRTIQNNPARTIARGFSWMAPLTLGEYYYGRKSEEWKRLPTYQKALFWNFLNVGGTGHDVIIPKPFLWGVMFGGSMTEALEWMDSKDPKHIEDFFKQMGKAGLPSIIPTAATTALIASTDYDLFRGKPVQSPGDLKQEPWMRFEDASSELSKALGRGGKELLQSTPLGKYEIARKALNISPMRFDALVGSTFGGAGRTAVSLVGGAGMLARKAKILPPGYFEGPENKAQAKVMAQIPILRSMIKSGGGMIDSEQVQSFYENLARTTQAKSTAKVMMEKDVPGMESEERYILAGMASHYRNATGELSELWKRMKLAENDEEKQEYANSINEIVNSLNRSLEEELDIYWKSKQQEE